MFVGVMWYQGQTRNVMDYRHTQPGWVTVPAILAGVLVLFSIPGRETGSLNHLIALGLLLVLLGTFVSLTVQVRDGFLRCHFGPGLIRRQFLLSDIEDARSVRNPWYSGWGIRWRPGQYVLWNVSGRKAVELVFKDGKRFRVGTDEPDDLVQAIQTNKTNYSTNTRKEI
jgi:hypothetical protein